MNTEEIEYDISSFDALQSRRLIDDEIEYDFAYFESRAKKYRRRAKKKSTMAKHLSGMLTDIDLSPHAARRVPLAYVEFTQDDYLTAKFRKNIDRHGQKTYAALYFVFADYSGLRWRVFDPPVTIHPNYVRKVIYGF